MSATFIVWERGDIVAPSASEGHVSRISNGHVREKGFQAPRMVPAYERVIGLMRPEDAVDLPATPRSSQQVSG